MINKPAILSLLVLFHFAAHAQQTYQLNVKKSKILWDNGKTMGGHHGFMMIGSGNLVISAAGASGNGFFTIDMNSMVATDESTPAGNASVNKKLREDNYFNMDKYPTATMNVKQIVPTGKPSTYKIIGDLTIKGTANPVAFTAIMITKGNTINATATTTINRLKWHIDMQTANKPWDFLGAVQNKVTPGEILIELNLLFTKVN
jgi:polyisoprenoid-binding protein YceI